MREAIVLIAIVLIGLILVGPSLMSGLGDLGENLTDWVKYGFEDGDNGNGDESEGKLSMGVTVQFKDGTQQTVKPEDLVFTLFPMTVYFEDKEVARIKFDCIMLLDWSGELKSFTVDGSIIIAGETERENEVDTVLKRIEINEVYGDEVPRNAWFCVDSIVIEAENIEILGDGDWFLRGYTRVDVQAEFPQATDTRSATARAEIPISIVHGTLTVFSVAIETEVLNP